MKFRSYHYHIRICNLHRSDSSLVCPHPGIIIRQFICDIPRADNIAMLDFTHVRTNAFADHGGFSLQAVINSLHGSLRTPAVRYMVN